MGLMNVSTYSCGDSSLGCSCGDCPASTACANVEPPLPDKKDSCSISIGSMKVGVNRLSLLSILYHYLLYPFYILWHISNYLFSISHQWMQINCFELSLALLYIVMISAFFGWVVFHRRREERRLSAATESLLENSDQIQGESSTSSLFKVWILF